MTSIPTQFKAGIDKSPVVRLGPRGERQVDRGRSGHQDEAAARLGLIQNPAHLVPDLLRRALFQELQFEVAPYRSPASLATTLHLVHLDVSVGRWLARVNAVAARGQDQVRHPADLSVTMQTHL